MSPGRRLERLPLRTGEMQCVSKQAHGFLTRGEVDTSLQIADRSVTQPRRPRQFLLCQSSFEAQLPQQRGKRNFR